MMNEDKNFMAEEVQQAYELKKQDVNAPSVDEAWKRFNAKHHVTEEVQPEIAPRLSFWKRYGVAACLSLVCVLAVAVTVVRSASFAPSEELGVRSEASGVGSEEYELAEIEENPTSVIYRNVALSKILEQLAQEHNARVEYIATGDVRLYVELDRGWSLQQSLDFLNHFEQVNLLLTSDQVIEVR